MQHRYQPMHAPKKDISEERMHEILARHAQSGAARNKVEVKAERGATEPAEPGKPDPPVLVWQEPRKDSEVLWRIWSVCERYAIHATRSLGKPWLYECLRRTPDWNNVLAYNVKTKAEALAVCETHARAHP